MSWEDLHARIEVIHLVLGRAATNPADLSIFNSIPNVKRLFGGAGGLLLALQYRWKIHLEAKIDQATSDGRPMADAVVELISEQPALYAILTTHFGGIGLAPTQNGCQFNVRVTEDQDEHCLRVSESTARSS
ncbi:hypothetical protein [Nocardia cyriacigeorgica]|uniref:hypothetical protein n=1 Tax=Nocardia cyriacigeorgica TaxID=135487 RepID=UPI00189612DE|nr:hypothetical protein [Nocardia cyriacigeorgica]MBF6288661.1 hypothetical protein [Nocardia cyriacigeorgica]